MKSFLFWHRFTFLLSIIGGISGYLYYYFIGCSSGACAISSNPFFITLYGGFMGFLAGYKPRKKTSE
jgi:hypothetical protein